MESSLVYGTSLPPAVTISYDRNDHPDSLALAAIETEDRAAVMDSLILCKFLRGVFTDFYGEAAQMLSVVTGWPFTAHELGTVAKRVVNARKCLNQREGWTAGEDTLPSRLLTESPAQPGASFLSGSRLRTMIAAYYRERGWTEQGRVPERLRRAGSRGSGLRIGLRCGPCSTQQYRGFSPRKLTPPAHLAELLLR